MECLYGIRSYTYGKTIVVYKIRRHVTSRSGQVVHALE